MGGGGAPRARAAAADAAGGCGAALCGAAVVSAALRPTAVPLSALVVFSIVNGELRLRKLQASRCLLLLLWQLAQNIMVVARGVPPGHQCAIDGPGAFLE